MVQFRAISKTDTSAKILADFERSAGELKKDVLLHLAAEVVWNSPVDTGNYMLSHEIVSGGRSGNFPERPTDSHGKPRQQDKGAKGAMALEKLYSQIAALLPGDTDFMLRNSARYAWRIEYGGWGEGSIKKAVGVTADEKAFQQAFATQPYRVYARARSMAPQFIADAKARHGFT
jgi:hypothetical protein